MPELITNRGFTECRVCASDELESVLNLGPQPLPAEYGNSPDEVMDAYPLHLRVCNECGLGQLGEYVLPERIFHKTYPYLSSASETWLAHGRQYAEYMCQALNLGPDTLVLELASNDGYLLKEFKKLGVPVLGVEPAKNVAQIAQGLGVPTINDFFGEKLANHILVEHGYPALIIANNVFAHIPDMHDFTKGMSVLADDRTIITIENPSFLLLLKNNLFDTIYHEHYSYLTAHSVSKVAQFHSLNLVRVDSLKTHGGSNRYWLSRRGDVDDSVAFMLNLEQNEGLFDPVLRLDFARRASDAISGLREWLSEKETNGDVVVGYGAAHKGNTFLNAVGEKSRVLKYVVDASFEKQGKYLPGSRVPVLKPEKLNTDNPTDVLILPWNIAGELTDQVQKLAPSARIWIAQPEMKQLA